MGFGNRCWPNQRAPNPLNHTPVPLTAHFLQTQHKLLLLYHFLYPGAKRREQEAVHHHTPDPRGLISWWHRHCAGPRQPEHLRDVFDTNVHTQTTSTAKFKGDSQIRLFFQKGLWISQRKTTRESNMHCHGTASWVEDCFVLLLCFTCVFWIPVWTLGIFCLVFSCV